MDSTKTLSQRRLRTDIDIHLVAAARSFLKLTRTTFLGALCIALTACGADVATMAVTTTKLQAE